jgi:hypothetical protein
MVRASRAASCLCAAGLLAVSTAVYAPQNTPARASFEDLARSAAAEDPGAQPSCGGYTGAAKESCEAYAKAAFDHQAWQLRYRERAYEAHHLYTMWVFVLVCALVALGMYLSLREFNLDSRRREALIARLAKRLKVRDEGDADAGAAPSTTLGIDTSGVKVTSPVLGVIILVVSMGFFYLYLKTVYPINEVTEPAARPAQDRAR